MGLPISLTVHCMSYCPLLYRQVMSGHQLEVIFAVWLIAILFSLTMATQENTWYIVLEFGV